MSIAILAIVISLQSHKFIQVTLAKGPEMLD